MLMKKMEMTRSLICPRRKKFVICRLFLTYKVQDDFLFMDTSIKRIPL